MLPRISRPSQPRRGFMLIEMLVVVALLVLMMTELTFIFQVATGSLISMRANQELAQRLRTLDGMLRRDLNGLTARLTPPLNPRDNLGYFEYGENSLADLQGEDSDDYLRFTTQSPSDQPFTGRLTVLGVPSVTPHGRYQQVVATSNTAEVVYFLRDGNLYRRVLLVLPQLQASLAAPAGASGIITSGAVYPPSFGAVSWQGANDISARPNFTPTGLAGTSVPVPNSLGDLTNRENRFASPRFCNDLTPVDGIPDDNNGDGVNDYYPTLYPNAFRNGLVNSRNGWPGSKNPVSFDTMAFPYIFPGMYSNPDPRIATTVPVRLHLIDPTDLTGANPAHINHSPLAFGDSLPGPTMAQYWWGFPTWHETMLPLWTDPYWTINVLGSSQSQAPFLTRAGRFFQWLPLPGAVQSQLKLSPTPATDKSAAVWQDDLIMTGVRSFDVKAFDPNIMRYNTATGLYQVVGSGYVDLGYLANDGPPNQPFSTISGLPVSKNAANPWILATQVLQGFGHEGRIPPYGDRSNPSGAGDHRTNPQLNSASLQASPLALLDDPFPDTLRLQRVFDTWSMAYTTVPIYSWASLSFAQMLGQVPPLYPSYPAPYPIPLRGIQIEIRLVDPSNTHVKNLTIRQDFSDKL